MGGLDKSRTDPGRSGRPLSLSCVYGSLHPVFPPLTPDDGDRSVTSEGACSSSQASPGLPVDSLPDQPSSFCRLWPFAVLEVMTGPGTLPLHKLEHLGAVWFEKLQRAGLCWGLLICWLLDRIRRKKKLSPLSRGQQGLSRVS